MKNVLSFIILFVLLHNMANAQSKFELLQGIWKVIDAPEKPIFKEDSDKVSYDFMKGIKSLAISYHIYGTDSYIVEGYVGFQNYSENLEGHSLTIDSLKITGKYYTFINKDNLDSQGRIFSPNYQTPDIIELENNLLWLNWGKVVMYEKVNELPKSVEKRLREECKKKNIDIDYFLGPPKTTVTGEIKKRSRR